MSIQPRKISAALAAEKSISLLVEELYGNTSKKAIALLALVAGRKQQEKTLLLLQKVGGL